jgi:hypothetical protein
MTGASHTVTRQVQWMQRFADSACGTTTRRLLTVSIKLRLNALFLRVEPK